MTEELEVDVNQPIQQAKKRFYIPIKAKFTIAIVVVCMWAIISAILLVPWFRELKEVTHWLLALAIVMGVAWLPGSLNIFLIVSLLLDTAIPFKIKEAQNEVTLLVAAYNEEAGIYNTIKYVANQKYKGKIKIIVIDNNSTDGTTEQAMKAKKDFGLDLICIKEEEAGKHFALNTGLKKVKTKLVITLDADTLLHPDAINNLIARYNTAPNDTAAVAGSMLARNGRENIITKMQEWDYFLSIASIKRMQGLYQGTLVAQGAFSIYETDVIREVGGWPDVIGEDIVVTWKILEKKHRVFFEPTAIAFTDVPQKLSHFSKQRSRWARGMFEALKTVKPWQQPTPYAKVSTGIDLFIPFIDFSFVFFFIPGIIMAICFQNYLIVGLRTLLVLPLNLITFYILYRYQKNQVFESMNLKVRKNKIGLVFFILTYQFLMSPISLWGYIQEVFSLKRVWK